MKYLFFDCYGGFDLQMAVSAMIDMADCAELARNTAGLIPLKSELITSRVTRCKMDAMLAHLVCDINEDKSIAELIEQAGLSDKIKSKLNLWHKLKSDGKPYKPEKEQRELMYAAICLSLIENLGIERIYVSSILQGNAMGSDGAEFKFIPSAHTELLCKMADIHTVSADVAKEILAPEAAAMLYILNAEYLQPKMHNVIKSGYGASDTELLEIANIARCIMAEDGEDTKDIYSDFEAIISDMNMMNYV